MFWLCLPLHLVPKWDITLLASINLLIFFPVIEEVLFRGIIQESLLTIEVMKKNRYEVSLANIVTSCIFTGLHILNQAVILAILILLPSLVLGIFKERYSSLFIPIMFHILFNTTFLLSLSIRNYY
ncbi:JDVT-CTERM system glutamic-type intramembrane protease [Vibrio sp. SCSIO 43140]|uniref:JDVT-CTERM system glutamic-type intramembrane protease MrtJ n=1 Tax=Vibrio sp. SCSIO 43140 TaxID=2819100 RepID=UPI00336573FC